MAMVWTLTFLEIGKNELMGRYSYKKAFEELLAYAEGEGYHAITYGGPESFIVWAPHDYDKRLNIEDGETHENMVYLILHELGHHQIRKNWGKFEKRLPAVAYAEQVQEVREAQKYKRRASYIVSCLEEEFMAWEEGLKLAINMNIKVNHSKWIIFKAKKLKAHINRCANLNK